MAHTSMLFKETKPMYDIPSLLYPPGTPMYYIVAYLLGMISHLPELEDDGDKVVYAKKIFRHYRHTQLS